MASPASSTGSASASTSTGDQKRRRGPADPPAAAPAKPTDADADATRRLVFRRCLPFLPLTEAAAFLPLACKAAAAALAGYVSELQQDLTLGASHRYSPLPCVPGPRSPPVPCHPPFAWAEALLIPPNLGDRVLVDQGCNCSGDDGCVGGGDGGDDEGACPCLARARREAAALAARGEAAATATGAFIPNSNVVVPFECASPRCCCQPDRCGLRASQRAMVPRLELRYHAGKGWGVHYAHVGDAGGAAGAGDDEPTVLPAGSFVCEYTGELVSAEEARRRQTTYDAQGLNYLLVVREEAEALVLRTSVDATRRGNVARFLNHSCDPNLDLVLVRAGALLPRLVFMARRAIAPDEELTFDYGASSASSEPAGEGVSEGQRQGQGQGRHACRCGAASCRGVLPYYAGL